MAYKPRACRDQAGRQPRRPRTETSRSTSSRLNFSVKRWAPREVAQRPSCQKAQQPSATPAKASSPQRKTEHEPPTIFDACIRDAGNWPYRYRSTDLAAIFLAIIVAGLFRFSGTSGKHCERGPGEEVKLKAQYAEKKAKAINFEL